MMNSSILSHFWPPLPVSAVNFEGAKIRARIAPRKLLDKGSSQTIVSALPQFGAKDLASVAEAGELALRVGIQVPA